jgi:hypothetical protein
LQGALLIKELLLLFEHHALHFNRRIILVFARVDLTLGRLIIKSLDTHLLESLFFSLFLYFNLLDILLASDSVLPEGSIFDFLHIQ